jgi:hypothetical protein
MRKQLNLLLARRRLLVALCLVILCLFLTSGGMNSLDGGSELAQAVHFCVTGHIAVSHPISVDFHVKGVGASRVWYDANDLGGTLLMLPAACLSAAHGAGEPASLAQLSSVAKGAASLTYALVGGLAVAFVFMALTEITTLRRSWWWSLAFLFATGILAYVKATWSMLPAATAVAAVAWIAVRASKDLDSPRKTVLLTALAVGAGGLARYSLLPFLAVAAVAAIFPALKRLSRGELILAALLLLGLVLPDFAYNALRTGDFLKPAQTSEPSHHVTLSYSIGTLGLFFGAKRGLLFFAPICFLGYGAAIYAVIRSQGELRWRWSVGFIAAIAYVVVVCAVQDWSRFGWGPRYLVPLIPALFLVAVALAERRQSIRPLAYVLTGLGVLTQLPLAFASWHAVASIPGKNQIVGLWESMLHGLVHGTGIGSADDPRALQVPDTWWWHGIARHVPHLVGLLLFAGLVAMIALAFRLLRGDTAAAAGDIPTGTVRPSAAR